MTAVLIGVIVWQFIDFFRELTNWQANKSAVITQATAWAGGILGVMLAAHAQVFSNVVFPGTDRALGLLDGTSLVFLGFAASSLASTGVDVKQALDGGDSSAKPPLLKTP